MKSLGSFQLTTNRDRLDKEKRVHTQRRCFQQIIAVSWLSSDMFFVFVLPGLASRKSITVRRRRLCWTRFWDTGTTNGLGPRGRTTQVIKKKVREKELYSRNGFNVVFKVSQKSHVYSLRNPSENEVMALTVLRAHPPTSPLHLINFLFLRAEVCLSLKTPQKFFHEGNINTH